MSINTYQMSKLVGLIWLYASILLLITIIIDLKGYDNYRFVRVRKLSISTCISTVIIDLKGYGNYRFIDRYLQAVRTKDVREYVKWMMYWIVFALYQIFEVRQGGIRSLVENYQ